MIALISVLFALCVVSINGQQPVDVGPTSPSYTPTSNSGYLQRIVSSTSSASDKVYVMQDWQAPYFVTILSASNPSIGGSYVSLNYDAPVPPVITRVRAAHDSAHDYLFAQDAANYNIAMYNIVNSTVSQLLRTINLYGFQTFQVTLDGRYLAVGGVAGAEFIEFIDVHDLQAGDQLLYRIPLNGLKARGFVFDPMDGNVNVILGDSTINSYISTTGRFYRNIVPNVPAGFNMSAISMTAVGNSKQFAVMDCNQPSVAFFSLDGLSSPSAYPMAAFNSSQCSESLSVVANHAFAALDSQRRLIYFTLKTPQYTPTSNSGYLGATINSMTSPMNDTVYVLTGWPQGVQALSANNGGGAVGPYIDLSCNSTVTPVITRVRAARSGVNGDYLFAEDSANHNIAMYGLMDTGNASCPWGVIRKFNLTGFQTFQVSADAHYLAVGGVAGAEFIDFIDMYDLQSDGDGYMYRIGLNGLKSRGFSFEFVMVDYWILDVIVGVNNTINRYYAPYGTFFSSVVANVPTGFNISAVASIVDGIVYQYAVMDCTQPRVAFFSLNDVIPASSYYMARFNPSQCSESLVVIDNDDFGVLDSLSRIIYFTLTTAAPGAEYAHMVMAPGTSSTWPASVNIAFILVSVVAFVTLAVVTGVLLKTRSANKLDLVKDSKDASLLARQEVKGLGRVICLSNFLWLATMIWLV